MLFFETPNSTIEWEEATAMVVVTRKEGIYVEGEESKVGILKILELVQLKQARKLLGRFDSLRIINRADLQWLIDEWSPALYKGGLRYFASTRPRGYTSEMSLKSVFDEMKWLGIKTGIFDSEDEARQWLASYS